MPAPPSSMSVFTGGKGGKGGKGGGVKGLVMDAAKDVVGTAVSGAAGGGGGRASEDKSGEKEGEEKLTVVQCIFKLLKGFLKVFKAMWAFLSEVVPLLWVITWASCMLLLFVVILIVVLYLIYVLNPRVPGINHIVDIEDYVKSEYNPKLVEAMKTVAAHASAPPAWTLDFPGFPELAARCAQVAGLKDRDTDLKVYLAFRSSVLNPTNLITRADLAAHAPQFVDGNGKFQFRRFIDTVVNPIDVIAAKAGQVSGRLHDVGDLRSYLAARHGIGGSNKAAVVSAVQLATAIHHLRMLLYQAPSIEQIYMASRPGGNAIWTLYYIPIFLDIFKRRIPNTWKGYPDNFKAVFNGFIKMWDKLGRFVIAIPTKVINQINSESFQNGELPEAEAEAEAEAEVRESFGLQDFFNLIPVMSSLFQQTILIATTVYKLMINLMSDPFGTLLKIFLIVLSVVLTLPITILYVVYTALMLHVVSATIWAFVAASTWCIIMTLFYVLTAILVAVPYFFLWIADIMTGGAVARAMRCENVPHAWHNDHGYVFDNAYTSQPLTCWGPCSQRYALALKNTCCKRLPSYMPDFCPQQQIYRIFAAKGTVSSDKGPLAFVNYAPPRGFASKSIEERQASVLEGYREKVGLYKACYDRLGSHDYLNRHLCDSIDVLFPYPNGSRPPAVNVAMATVCKEIFCDYRPAGGGVARNRSGFQNNAPGAGGNAVSCTRFVGVAANPSTPPEHAPGPALLRHTLLVTVGVLVVMLSFRSITEAQAHAGIS